MNRIIAIPVLSIFGLILMVSCQTVNPTLIKDDPEFNLYDMQKKMVYIVPAQIVENNIIKKNELPVMKPSDAFDVQNIDVDLQNLLAQNFTEELGLFPVKTINKEFILENNNGTLSLIPTAKVDNQYKARINSDFKINSLLTAGCDYIFVPIALQLDAVENVNKPFKSIDLVDPGYRASISYVIYDVKKNNIAVSGLLIGSAERSGMINTTLGRNAILLAMNSAINNLLAEFRK